MLNCCRHVGDLGNVEAINGVVDTTIIDWLVTMFGPDSVIGKAIVVSISQNIHYFSRKSRHLQPTVPTVKCM